jgi:predicted dehydrogenase
VRLPAPSRPAFSASPPRLLIIGAGNRGRAYARAIRDSSNGILVGVVEPVTSRRENFGRKFIWGPEAAQQASALTGRNGQGAQGRTELFAGQDTSDSQGKDSAGTDFKPAPGQAFADWRDFVEWEEHRRESLARHQEGERLEDVPPGIDGVFICVQDAMHKDVVLGIAHLGLHIMCEKPLCPTLADCLAIYQAIQPHGVSRPAKTLFSVGHVLRYSPHNMLLRKLLVQDRVIGEVQAVNHTEPVGWSHFTHSYVRGNWRNEAVAAPSLLAKCCHDVDILYWLLATPAPDALDTGRHLPQDVSSSGSLQYFTKRNKPSAAGKATNCLSCAYEPECRFSAKRIYTDPVLANKQQAHFAGIIAPEIEDLLAAGDAAGANKALMARLAEDYDASTPVEEIRSKQYYGRCVYEADNDVCDNQTVTLAWDADPSEDAIEPDQRWRGAKTATLQMIAFSDRQCQRETHIYGVKGEIYADSFSIRVTDFKSNSSVTHYPHVPNDGSHGDGDAGLTRQFVLAIDRVKNEGMNVQEAQRQFIGCELRDVVMAHALVFAAEEARLGRKIVDFPTWWEREVEGKLGAVTKT